MNTKRFRLFSFVALFLTTPLLSHAASLECQISVNGEKVLSAPVQTLALQKISIGRIDGISAYVTEKTDSIFLVEAFLASQEARIYAEGSLKNTGESLAATFWGRQSWTEITCRKP